MLEFPTTLANVNHFTQIGEARFNHRTQLTFGSFFFCFYQLRAAALRVHDSAALGLGRLGFLFLSVGIYINFVCS